MKHWRDQAACLEYDAELWFPVSYEGRHGEQEVRLAKDICADCSVLAACQEWAVAALPDGIAGGLTPEERTDVRRRRGWSPIPPVVGTGLKRTVGVGSS